MTTIQIVKSSPQAEAIAKNPLTSAVGQKRYPFDSLEVGQSFTLPKAEAKIASLKVIASRKSKNGKRYTVIEHESPPVVEVARIS